MFTRRSVLTGLAVLASAAPITAFAQERVVRMGYQKVGAFALLKARGILEQLDDPDKPLFAPRSGIEPNTHRAQNPADRLDRLGIQDSAE